MNDRTQGFPTIIGRGLLGEVASITDRPFGLVTMADVWALLCDELPPSGSYWRLDVAGLERAELESVVAGMPEVAAVVGLGGGQALDVAKYIAWRKRLPLFQYPTALSVNAGFGHRAAVREGGVVSYVGWKVPEAVFVDLDVIRGAPAILNRSGVADVLCYHTAHWDWRVAAEEGMVGRWPYDESLVAEAASALQAVWGALDEIRDLTDEGIRVLVEGLRWGGAAFAYGGWNPRHIEGSEHFFFYSLERVTDRHFIHGQPVGLGLLLMSAWQGNEPERVRDALDRVGLPYQPESMGISWADVREALRRLPATVEEAGLWYTVASKAVTDEFLDQAEAWLASDGPTPDGLSSVQRTA